jgi:hypothetical protein
LESREKGGEGGVNENDGFDGRPAIGMVKKPGREREKKK